MSSCGPLISAARCHTRRSGSASSISASAWWTRRRCATLALWRTAERINGWRKRTVRMSRSTIAARTAGSSAATSIGAPFHSAAGAEHFVDVLAVDQSRDQHKQSGVVRKVGHASSERSLQSLGQWDLPGHRRARLQPGGRRGSSISASGLPAASRSSRSRTAIESSLADASSSSAATSGASAPRQSSGSPAWMSAPRCPSRDSRQQDDPVGLQASGDECQHVRGRAVKPMGVLHDHQQRRLSRDLGDQVEDRHRDAEMLRRGVLGPSEGRVKRSAERRRQVRRAGPHRTQSWWSPEKASRVSDWTPSH